MTEQSTASPEYEPKSGLYEWLDAEYPYNFVCACDGTTFSFGSDGSGNPRLLITTETGGRFAATFDALPEPAIARWVTLAITRGLDDTERREFYEATMNELSAAKLKVQKDDIESTSFAAPVVRPENGELQDYLDHPEVEWPPLVLIEKFSNERVIRLTADAKNKRVTIINETNEASLAMSYKQAKLLAIGFTVYGGGRMQPEEIEKVFEGLLL